MSGVDDVQTGRTKHKAPYTAHHPVPTVQKYREEKAERQVEHGAQAEAPPEAPSKKDRIGDAWNTLRHGQDAAHPTEHTQPYPAENKNFGFNEEEADDHAGRVDTSQNKQDSGQGEKDENTAEDTTEGMLQEADPRKARKAMKKFDADGTERQVTDPITHLPVTIHDFTTKELKQTPKNGPPAGSEPRSATGGRAMNKSDEQLDDETKDTQEAHEVMETLFPPPEFDMTREGITDVYRKALTVGLGIISIALSAVVGIFHFTQGSTGLSRTIFTLLEVAVSLGVSGGVIVGMRQWTENRIRNIWETEVWQAERQLGKKKAKSQTAESAQWLNSLLASIWPLINPDLFTAISDTLEVSSYFYIRGRLLTIIGCYASKLA